MLSITQGEGGGISVHTLFCKPQLHVETAKLYYKFMCGFFSHFVYR